MNVQSYVPSGYKNWLEYYTAKHRALETRARRRLFLKEVLGFTAGIIIVLLAYSFVGYVEWYL